MNKIDLSGIWALYMDENKCDDLPEVWKDEITLPNTTSNARKGRKNEERASGYLTDPYKFEGYAWFKREIAIDKDYYGCEMYLRLERTRMTAVYIDGEKIGEENSLTTPHTYKLPLLEKGVHTVIVRVNNTDYQTKGGHLTSPDTQTNWNGITGAIELLIRPIVHIDDVMVTTDIDSGNVIVSCISTGKGRLSAAIDDDFCGEYEVFEGKNSFTVLPKSKLSLWDEFSPNVHKLTITMNGETVETSFGMRKISTNGRKLLMNGREIFLRGKHDGMIFPLTGYAPTDVEGWLKVMQTAKEYGINHYRFHTCCPPEAAFTAADMLGIYMEPELPFWGTVKDEIDEEQQYLIDEGFRIIKEYGNHPSFVMMSLGNELWGSKEVMSGILRDYKAFDSRRLYTDGSNNFQFVPCVPENSDFLCGVRLSADRLYRGSYAMCDAPQGHIQTCPPDSCHNYDKIIVPEKLEAASAGGKIQIQYGTGVKEVEADSAEMFIPDVPVISHEVGQYETYPDYREIAEYTGTLKAENIALYREKAEEKGLLPFAEDFFRASGALAVQCYKAEIEAALRTENLSGFQLLDIQDFTGQGTALVGVLNSLMKPKGTVSADEWRCFCDKTVIMAEFPKFVYSAEESIDFTITLFNTDPDFSADFASYEIKADNEVMAAGKAPIKCEKRVNRLGKVCFDCKNIATPTEYTLYLRIDGTLYHNSYKFIVYPENSVKITENEISCGKKSIRIVHSEEETENCLQKGIKALLIPDSEGKLPGTYCTDFWCYPMFKSISEWMKKPVPIGTLGCLIDKNSKILKEFPTESYSQPQWFEIIMHSHCENLDGTDIIPVVWAIDNPDRAQKLGVIFEKETKAGKITVCTSRLWEIADKPEAKQLALSILDYTT